MASVAQTRRRLVIVLVVFLALDAAAIALLFSPWVRSDRETYDALESELHSKRAQVQPLRGIDEKLEKAKGDIAAFSRDRLPRDYSTLASELGKLAADNKVKLAQVKFDEDTLDVTDIRRIGIDAALTGNYQDVVRFINAVERSKVFFILESVNLGEQTEGGLRLQLRFETYLRRRA